MAWLVIYHRKVEKELGKLPVAVQKALYRLAFEIELSEVDYAGTHEKAPC